MKSIAISGSARQNVGKRDAKQLRYAGQVPCVLYGGPEQYHFSASAADLRPLIYTPEAMFVDLDIEGKKFQAVLKDIQFHPVSDEVLHVDFLQLFQDKPVKMDVPVKLTGVSPGVRAGGKLTQSFRKLSVKGFPKHMVDFIEVSIESLEVGDSIRVKDLKLDNLEVLNKSEDTIVKIDQSRATRSAQAGENA